MSVIEKIMCLLSRLLNVLVENDVISNRDMLYIRGDMSEAEWTGDEDE